MLLAGGSNDLVGAGFVFAGLSIVLLLEGCVLLVGGSEKVLLFEGVLVLGSAGVNTLLITLPTPVLSFCIGVGVVVLSLKDLAGAEERFGTTVLLLLPFTAGEPEEG